MLTMLAVNLDLPLSFLLLDGSLVNFHGGRMTWDQVKLRLEKLQSDQIVGLHNPTYAWLTRHRITQGSPFYDAALSRAYQAGRCNPFRFQFRTAGWPYVKPMEDVAAEDLAERRGLRSMKEIQASHGKDIEDHIPEVIAGRSLLLRTALIEARKIVKEYPDAELQIGQVARELAYGSDPTGAAYTEAAAKVAKVDAIDEQNQRNEPALAVKGESNG
jgi:hypothetical protein